MKKNTAYRSRSMTVRTSMEGDGLTIYVGPDKVTLPEYEADQLCRWMMGLFGIDVEIPNTDLGRMIKSLAELPRSLTAALDRHSVQLVAANRLLRVPRKRVKRTVKAKKRTTRKAKAHK